jgi:hypothetical protein
MENKIIGYVVGGGLKESFRVRLTVDPLTVQEGAFVVIASGDYHFYGLDCLRRWRRLCMGRLYIPISKCCPR